MFGYTGAARALAEAGARVDNIFFGAPQSCSVLSYGCTSAYPLLAAITMVYACAAAGLGNLAATSAHFDGALLKKYSVGTYRSCMDVPTPSDQASIVQEAFHFAVTHGHQEVAKFIMGKGAETNGSTIGHRRRLPLMQALFVFEHEMARFLLQHGANPFLKDGKLQKSAIETAGGDSRPGRQCHFDRK